VESLSSYARMFLGQMEKPEVDYIEGLSPAISIDQKSTSNNPRSTVGTVTEIHDYFRPMYARMGTPHCPDCGRVISRQSVDQVVDQIKALGEGTRIQVIAPAVRARKGEHQKLFDQIRKDGYVRVRVDGVIYDINEVPALDKKYKHTIDVIVDRLVIREGFESRLSDSLETAFAFGEGLVKIDVNGTEELTFSQNYACPDCGVSIEELTPRMFSFNNPFGACPTCMGLGMMLKMDEGIIVPNHSLSLAQGAISVTGWQSDSKDTIAAMYFNALAERYGFSLDTPWNELSETAKKVVLYGTGSEKLHIADRKSVV
jgi:excinuclease ABC subunit A